LQRNPIFWRIGFLSFRISQFSGKIGYLAFKEIRFFGKIGFLSFRISQFSEKIGFLAFKEIRFFGGRVRSSHSSTLSSTRVAFLGPCFQSAQFNFVIDSRCLFGAKFSVLKTQLCHRLAILGPCFQSPRFIFSRHSSILSSTRVAFLGPCFQSAQFNFVIDSRCLFGAKFSVLKTQLCHRLAILGPCFQSAQFNFVIESPFWGRVRSRHGSTLSSNRHFGARFSVSTVQLCHRIAILGPCEKPPRLNFVIESPFWGRVRSRHGSTLSSNRVAFLGPCEKSARFNFIGRR
jgi:hypothetical protein